MKGPRGGILTGSAPDPDGRHESQRANRQQSWYMLGCRLGGHLTRTLAFFVIAIALLKTDVAAAEPSRGPSTPAERKRVVEITRKLEKAPFGPGADADREWLMKWIDEVPDVTVRYCQGPLYELVNGAAQDRKLWLQSLFGIATFEIEHPDEASHWVKAQEAGLESAITSYQSLLKADPAAKISVFEKLIAAQKAGKLADVVREEMPTCNPEEVPPDAI